MVASFLFAAEGLVAQSKAPARKMTIQEKKLIEVKTKKKKPKKPRKADVITAKSRDAKIAERRMNRESQISLNKGNYGTKASKRYFDTSKTGINKTRDNSFVVLSNTRKYQRKNKAASWY